MEEYLFRSTKLTDLFHWLDNPNFVVDCHDAHKRRVWSNGGLELLQINDAVVLNRQVCDFESVLLQMPATIKNAFMLCLSGDDVLLLSRPTKEPCHALDAHIVAFCCSASEDDLLRIRPDQVCDVLPCLF